MSKNTGINRPKQPANLERYLTDIKELVSYDDKESSNKAVGFSTTPKQSHRDTPTLERGLPSKRQMKEESMDTPKLNVSKHEFFQNYDKSSRLLDLKDIFLCIINIISFVILIILLVKLPQKAEEFKTLRNQILLTQTEVSVNKEDVENSLQKADQLSKLFIDEVGLVNFVNDIEGLKSQGAAIKKVSITSTKPIKDKTGNFGIPVIIEISGSWQQFADDILKIQKLPYLFRTAKLDIETGEEEIVFNYGVFLYAKDQLVKD